MARRRRLIKTKTLYTLLALLGGALLLSYLSEQWERAPALDPVSDAQFGDRVDYYLTNPNTLQFTAEGQRQYQLKADQLEHLERSDVANISEPRFTTFLDNRIEWRGRSKNGQVEQAGRKVVLIEGVALKRTVPQQTEIYTESLTLYPRQQLANTKVPVTLLEPGSKTTADALNANFDTGRIQLTGNVRGHYESP